MRSSYQHTNKVTSDKQTTLGKHLITQVHGVDDTDIAVVKDFIKAQFSKKYDADINTFMPQLVSITNKQGNLRAAVGYRSADQHPLFLEQYIASPIEQMLSDQEGLNIPRSQIVEVGNLACVTSGYARIAIIKLTEMLHNAGYQWVVFTLTKELVNSFKKLNLSPQYLEAAKSEKITSSDNWGSYYDTSPTVMYGNITTGLRLLQA